MKRAIRMFGGSLWLLCVAYGSIDISIRQVPRVWANDRLAGAFVAMALLHFSLFIAGRIVKDFFGSPERSPSDG